MSKHSPGYKIQTLQRCPYCDKKILLFDCKRLEGTKSFTCYYCLACDKCFKITTWVENKWNEEPCITGTYTENPHHKPTQEQIDYFKKMEGIK